MTNEEQKELEWIEERRRITRSNYRMAALMVVIGVVILAASIVQLVCAFLPKVPR